MSFGGVDPLLIGWMTQHLGIRCALDTPADLQDVVPLVKLEVISGPSLDNYRGAVAANLATDCFASDYDAASTLAWDADKLLRLSLPGTSLVDEKGARVTFGKVRTLTIPSRRPWNDIAVRRYGATYQVWMTARF